MNALLIDRLKMKYYHVTVIVVLLILFSVPPVVGQREDSKDLQQSVFERFIQADQSKARSYEGAGLGLSIAKAFVEMLGREIWVESELGKGSQFYYTIP